MERDLVAKRLLTLRADKTREEVSQAIGTSISALQMYENGQRMPKDDIKVKLAEYYGVTVQGLFFDNEPHELCGMSTA